MKKVFIIFCSISIILCFVIFIIYKTNNNKTEEVVDIFKDEKEDNKKEKIEKNEVSDTVIVDIKGMVNSPGVYEVDSNLRVNDVIILAGGLKEGADTSKINLAKIVSDEMTIIIYSNEEILEKYKNDVCVCDCPEIKNDACINEEEDNLININTASIDEIMTIRGIGKSKAEAIIKYREDNGNFNSIEEVKNVSGIGESLFEKIKDYIKV